MIGILGRYEDPVLGFYGAPQSVASHRFVEPEPGGVGFFFEAAPVHPVLAASVLPKSERKRRRRWPSWRILAP